MAARASGQALTQNSARRDAAVIVLVGIAHATSHLFHLLVPPLFPLLMPDFDFGYRCRRTEWRATGDGAVADSGGRHRTGDGAAGSTQLSVTWARHQMVVDHAHRLHLGVANRRADEFEATAFQFLRHGA